MASIFLFPQSSLRSYLLDRNGTPTTKMYRNKVSNEAIAVANPDPGILKRAEITNPSSKITKLCKAGRIKKAFETLNFMDEQGIPVTPDMYSSLLDVCTKRRASEQGKFIHNHILRNGFEREFPLRIKLVLMYVACDDLNEASLIFNRMSKPTVFAWNTMLIAYVQRGLWEEALDLYQIFQHKGLKPDNFTFSTILKACSSLNTLQIGQQLHCQLIKMGFDQNMILISVLVGMYAQCGQIESARLLFDKMPQRDVISWNSMITAYSAVFRSNDALGLYRKMRQEGVVATETTVVAVLQACARSAYLQQGQKIHAHTIKSGFESNVYVSSTLVDVYVESGVLDDAEDIFRRIPDRNVVTWTAMIAGYGMSGHGSEALKLFHQMLGEGLKPNHVTFVAVLSACSHSGLILEGEKYFKLMDEEYGITPKLEHYSCLVDIYGRAGLFDKAVNCMNQMPVGPDSRVWGALLGSCRIHCNVELAEIAANHLFYLEPKNAGNYIILSQIYASVGRWNDAEMIRTLMHERGVKKRAGCSWIEVRNQVYYFTFADTSNPISKKIYSFLDTLLAMIKEVGYVPDIKLVIHEVTDREKEIVLRGHSEKLAIAFGLITNISQGVPIRITKNLRVCDDCHNATKFISRVTGRDIIARDGNRFHHFSNGACSCGDYW